MKIKNILFGFLMLLSMVTSVVAMPANGWHNTAVGPVANSAIGTTFQVSFGSEGSNTVSRGLGTFEILNTSYGTFTTSKDLAPGIYTIKFTPMAGFEFASFRLLDGVHVPSGTSTGGSVSHNSVSTGTTPMPSTNGGPVYSLPAPSNGVNSASAQVGIPNMASAPISIGNGPQPGQPAYITVQVTGPGMVLAYAADVQAPTVSTDGGTYVSYGGPMYVTVTANAADNDPMYPPLVKLKIDGSDYTMDATAPGEFEYSLSLAPGTHAYTVEATDAVGLVTSKSSTVTVNELTIGDSQNPTVTITAPTGNVNTGSVTITATASDNVGVTNVELSLNGNIYAMTSSGSNSYSYTASLSAGSYPITITANDAAHNIGTATATINVVDPTNNGGNPGGNNNGGYTSGTYTSGSSAVVKTTKKATSGGTVSLAVTPKAEAPIVAAINAEPAQKPSVWASTVAKLVGLNLMLLILLLIVIFGMR